MRKNKYRILNTELSIAAYKVGSEYLRLKNDVAAKARLIEEILLYDRIHLVTSNFLLIPLLVEWAGIDNLLRLLKANRIGFTRYKGFIGYDGKHKGIVHFLFNPRLEGKLNKDWLKIADTADINESVWAILKNTLSSHKKSSLEELESLVVTNTKPVDYKIITASIGAETKNDFLDKEIRKKLRIESQDIESACDIGNNQIKIGLDEGPFGPRKSREIDKALAIGLTNFDLIIGRAIGDVDIHTDNISQIILEAKLKRCLKSRLIDEGFNSLLLRRNIPDFRNLVERDLLNFDNIFDLLNSGHHIKFISWLHNLKLESADDVTTDYIDKLESIYSKQNLLTRIIRFLVPIGLGKIVPPAGLAAAAVDSLIVEKLLRGWNPKLFLDKFRSTIEDK